MTTAKRDTYTPETLLTVAVGVFNERGYDGTSMEDLSQRLGEGVLNGLLTARLGLAAVDVTRPLPFTALPRPALGDLAKDLLLKRDADE